MKIDTFETKHEETVNLSDFSILVGPNNTGKSQTLRDIYDLMYNGIDNTPTTIVTSLDFHSEPFESYSRGLSQSEEEKDTERMKISGIGPEMTSTESITRQKSSLERVEDMDDILEDQWMRDYGLKLKVTFLDASSRLEIATKTQTYDFEDEDPSNAVQKLNEDSDARQKLRDTFQFIFDADIMLGFSSVRNFRLRVSDDFGGVEDNLFRTDANPTAPQIDGEGAGYRSLAGVIISLLLSESRIVLLDEPEAFLHPEQARRFGAWVARHVEDIPGQVIISTHNSHFLSGVLSRDTEVNIHYLSRSGDRTTYNSISETTLSSLSADPLLSNQRVIESIFHQGTIVCEGDSYSTIYRYVSENICNYRQYMFTHAHNKQTIHRICEALYAIRIPQAVIVDLDVITTPGDLKGIVEATAANDEEVNIHNTCNKFKIKIAEEEISKRILKKEGIEGLPTDLEELAKNIIDRAEEFGVFIVPVGELEEWVEIDTTKGSQWVVDALDYLSDNSCSDDMMEFIEKINQYFEEMDIGESYSN